MKYVKTETNARNSYEKSQHAKEFKENLSTLGTRTDLQKYSR